MSGDSRGGLEILETLFVDMGAASGHENYDKAFFIGIEELKERAVLLNADAVIGLHQSLRLDTNGFQYFYMQLYGTAVRYK